MFKDTKALVNKLVDSATEPITTFDATMKDNPELIVPLAALHTSVIVASIAATTAVICGFQQVRIAKEQTKQIRTKAMLAGHGKHHPGCQHGGCRHHQHGGPKMLAQHHHGRRQAPEAE